MLNRNGTGPSPDVVIVGGGVIGCAIAYELSRQRLKVLLLEKDTVGSGASYASAGMLAPLSDSREDPALQELGERSFGLYPTFLESVQEDAGLNVECLPSGIIRTAMDEQETAELRTIGPQAKRLGLPVHWLSGDEARKIEPLIGPAVTAASYSPDEPHLNPSRLVEALRRAAVAHGATVQEHVPVTGLLPNGDRVEGVQTAGGPVFAGAVVLAMGSWSCFAGGWLGTSVPVYPVRGQVLYANRVERPLRHTVIHGNAYATPKGDGTLLGTTVEHAGFDARVTLGGINAILGGIHQLLPGFAESSINHTRAGLRPWSTDGLPLLGPVPDRRGLVLACGHHRSGILLTPVTAQLVAGHFTGKVVDFGPHAAGRLEKVRA
jgi:glycine oxidase